MECSKYFRTEDGIYTYGTDGRPTPPYYCIPSADGTKLFTKEGLSREYPLEEHTIVEQADSVEELFDEVVIYYSNGYHLIIIDGDEITFKDNFDYGFKLEFALENGYEIYGAIWIVGEHGEPILKTVAKMNDKREWELI